LVWRFNKLLREGVLEKLKYKAKNNIEHLNLVVKNLLPMIKILRILVRKKLTKDKLKPP